MLKKHSSRTPFPSVSPLTCTGEGKLNMTRGPGMAARNITHANLITCVTTESPAEKKRVLSLNSFLASPEGWGLSDCPH